MPIQPTSCGIVRWSVSRPARGRRAYPYVVAERLVVAPDCGMKYLPRASAEGKMRAMADAAALLRTELEE